MINLEDRTLLQKLLGREEDVFTLAPEIWAGKRVFVTGAAGTIGASLVRRILTFAPERVVAVDHSDTGLNDLTQTISPGRTQSVVPQVADVRNQSHMAALLRQHKPHILLHAAALKHVASLEKRVCDAIETNTLATFRLVREAERQGVERFISVSTDKAVYPASIMGASKRLAELLLASGKRSVTQVASFRCGNVLASSGSVLPIWLERIALKLPLPLTDLRAERYFVSANEVTSALLHVTVLASAQPLFTYDLRAPIRISELARRLFDVLGLERPPCFQVTGLLPGEKLVEDLRYDDEQFETTCTPAILAVHSNNGSLVLDSDTADELAAQLSRCCQMRDLRGTMHLIRTMIPSYRPSALINEQLAA